MTSRMRTVAATLVLAFAATVATAEIGPYVGLSVGQAQVDTSIGDIGSSDFSIDGDDLAFKLFVGLELLGPLAIEASYRDFGSVTDGNGVISATSQSDGVDVFLVGRLPLGPVSLFAKGGFIAWDSRIQTSSSGNFGPPDIRLEDDGTNLAWGVGVAAEVWKVSVRGEVERFELDLPGDITMMSVGVAFEF